MVRRTGPTAITPAYPGEDSLQNEARYRAGVEKAFGILNLNDDELNRRLTEVEENGGGGGSDLFYTVTDDAGDGTIEGDAALTDFTDQSGAEGMCASNPEGQAVYYRHKNAVYFWTGPRPSLVGLCSQALTPLLSDYFTPFGALVDWDDITNKPSTFPPDPHTHPLDQVPGPISGTQPWWRISDAWTVATFDALTGKPATYPPSPHTHVENDITDLDRVRWRGAWVDGSYLQNDMVRDEPYTMIANTDTSDRAGPVDVGTEAYLYDGSDPTTSLTAKTLLVGNTYTAATAVKVTGYRVYTVAGNYYSVYLKDLSTGEVTELISFEAGETGWTENGAHGTILDAGTSFEVAVFVQEPDPTPVTFTGNWDYETPNNVTAPGSGQIGHANKALDILSVHKTDNDGTDRSVELLGISPGDTIETASVRWAVSLVVDKGTYVDYTVSPQLQSSPTGVVTFAFETVSSTPITVLADPDYYLGSTEVRPFYSVDGAARVLTDDAYNIDIKTQPVSLSPDWDVVAVSGTGGGGGGGSGNAKVSVGGVLPDTPSHGDQHYLTVEPVGMYVYVDENILGTGTSAQWVQQNGGGTVLSGFVEKTGDTMTGNLSIDVPSGPSSLELNSGDGYASIKLNPNDEFGGLNFVAGATENTKWWVFKERPSFDAVEPLKIARHNPADGVWAQNHLNIGDTTTTLTVTDRVVMQNTDNTSILTWWQSDAGNGGRMSLESPYKVAGNWQISGSWNGTTNYNQTAGGYVRATSYDIISDVSRKSALKANEINGLASVNAIALYTYDQMVGRNADGAAVTQQMRGAVAQHVKASPQSAHLVTPSVNPDTGETLLNISQTQLTWDLVSAVQEQQKMIDALTARLVALENKNA